MTQHIEHPEHFKDGVRILMRVLRTKDGGVGNVDRHAKKLISRNAEEFDRNMEALVRDMLPTERIYSTVDSRDCGKAIRTFKQLQLDNDYTPDPENFYIDIYNRWVSSLQQPRARASSYFLFDFDSLEEVENLVPELNKIDVEGKLYVHHYFTKNGMHIITKPFNYTVLPEWSHPIVKKNAMMLWVY